MALQFEVKKYKVEEEFTFKYEGGEKVIPIKITYKEAEELKDMSDNNISLDRFSEIMFKDNVEFLKEKAGLGFDDMVFSVGFQLLTTLAKSKIAYLDSVKSLQKQTQQS